MIYQLQERMQKRFTTIASRRKLRIMTLLLSWELIMRHRLQMTLLTQIRQLKSKKHCMKKQNICLNKAVKSSQISKKNKMKFREKKMLPWQSFMKMEQMAHLMLPPLKWMNLPKK